MAAGTLAQRLYSQYVPPYLCQPWHVLKSYSVASWGHEWFSCTPITQVIHTESRQGNEQTRTFEPTNESADCRSAIHSYNFIIRVK